MIRAVFDCNAVMAGLGWRSEPYLCLVHVKDDTYLACALAAKADFIVSRDPDLLVLEKPFGVEMVTPRAFLNRVTSGG